MLWADLDLDKSEWSYMVNKTGNDNRKLTTCANRILTTPNMIDVQ